MIKIGRREVLANFPQLQIPRGDITVIDVDVYGWKLKVEIEFEDNGAEQSVQIAPIGVDGVKLLFKNWSNPIGMSLKKPGHLARLQAGGALEFSATNYRVGDTNLFSLQLLHDKEAT